MRGTAFVAPALATAALFFAAGCGGESFALAPVSGKVTLNGQPLAGARVAFLPQAPEGQFNVGPQSEAVTREDGTYALTCVTGKPGAVVGRHKVMISTYVTKPDPKSPDELIMVSPERIPERYNDLTTLAIEIPKEGRKDADFALTAP
jgi:hypothetical protein